jgi:hypothetical protein
MPGARNGSRCEGFDAMDGFQKTMLGAAVVFLLVIVIAFFWPGILYYAALALAILFFPIIIAMCGGFGITTGQQE